MKENKLAIVVVLLLFFTPLVVFSQETTLPHANELVSTPSSPEAASFVKYGNIDSNLYTGTPNISIPIYQIQGRELSWPISLSYDASGVKVSQLASSTGLGWNLNYGGVITRNINGFPDRSTEPYTRVYSEEVQNVKGIIVDKYLNSFLGGPLDAPEDRGAINTARTKYETGQIDLEEDTFSFNINGYSGVIWIDYNESGESGGYRVFCPDQPNLKIEYELWGNEISKWIIYDEKGTRYTFEKKERTYTDYKGAVNEFEYEYVSSWYITEVVSPNQKDVLKFNYTAASYWQIRNNAPNRIIENRRIDNSCNDTGGGPPNNGDRSTPHNSSDITVYSDTPQYNIEQFSLSNIKLNGNVVLYVNESSSVRLDVPGKSKINKIYIVDKYFKAQKEVEFEYSYFNQNPTSTNFLNGNIDKYNKRLKLDKVKINPVNNQFIDTTGVPLSLNTLPPSIPSKEYSFEYFSPNSLPSTDSASQDYWGYFNGSNDSDMVASSGTLTLYGTSYSGANRSANLDYAKIGTLSKITYPTGGYSEFVYELHGTMAGGLRISKIRDKPDESSTALIKKYSYGQASVHQQLKFAKLFTDTRMNTCSGNRENLYRLQRYSNNIAKQVKHPITYGVATERVYNETTNTYNGYKKYHFLTTGYGSYSEQFSDMYGGKMSKIQVYDSQNNLLEEEEYNYTKVNISTLGTKKFRIKAAETAIRVCLNWESNPYYALSVGERNGLGECNSQPGNNSQQLDSYTRYTINKYTRFERKVHLDSVVKRKYYTSTLPLITKEIFTYNDSKHNKPIEIQTTDSKGKVSTKKIVYSGDYEDDPNPNGLSLQIIQDMIANHALVNPITITSFYDENPEVKLAEKHIIYNKINGKYLPEKIQGSKGNHPLEDRIIYHDYDSMGNPVEVSAKDGSKIYYVWGYDQTQPIAKIEDYTDAQLLAIQNLITNAIDASNLDNSRCLDSGTCNEKNLRTALNAIRNSSNMSSAQVTTFTYDPLVGVTSITDPRGETVYYNYDEFNRLDYVTDSNGKVLSKTKYNYKN